MLGLKMAGKEDENIKDGRTFLAIPFEIRSIIYDLLFEPGLEVAVFASPIVYDDEDDDSERQDTLAEEDNSDGRRNSTTWRADVESWAIRTTPELRCSSQLLVVCRQVYYEALPILYNRVFDLTGREAPQLLMHNIGCTHFQHIKRVIITWDTLEEFSRLLNKQEYIDGTSGLTELYFANWRIRHVGGVALSYRNVKGQERSMLEAAHNIVSKHRSLTCVAERMFVRRGSVLDPNAADSTIRKVKWRLLAAEDMLIEDEKVLDLDHELEQVVTMKGQAEVASMPMMDPF